MWYHIFQIRVMRRGGGMKTRLKMIYWKSEKFLGKLLGHPEIMTQGEIFEELEENMKEAYLLMAPTDKKGCRVVKRMAAVTAFLFSVFLTAALTMPGEAFAYYLSVKATHIVSGAVTPYPGVTVTIKNPGSSIVLKTLQTGATGIAKFTLNGGSYIVSCATDRYEFTPLKKTVLLDSNKLLTFNAVDEAAVENIRRKLVAVIATFPELAVQTRRSPAYYQTVADEMAKVPGVQAADYSGDTLGTFYIKVRGGGVIGYRHIKGDMNENPSVRGHAH